MQFELLTLSGVKFSGQVNEVVLKTTDGDIAILPHHEPLTAVAEPGPVIVKNNGKEDIFAIYGGLVDVVDNKVRLLADEADHADDLIEAEIEESLAKAEAARAGLTEKRELNRAQQLVDRNAVRLGVARIKRRRHGHH